MDRAGGSGDGTSGTVLALARGLDVACCALAAEDTVSIAARTRFWCAPEDRVR